MRQQFGERWLDFSAILVKVSGFEEWCIVGDIGHAGFLQISLLGCSCREAGRIRVIEFYDLAIEKRPQCHFDPLIAEVFDVRFQKEFAHICLNLQVVMLRLALDVH